MARPILRRSMVALAFSLMMLPLAAQQRDRSKIPEQYTWNLADLYPSEAAWRSEITPTRAHQMVRST